MTIRRVALIYDDKVRPDTTGTHCRSALEELVEVVHFHPSELDSVPRDGFDLYLSIDDGLRYHLPDDLRPSAWWAIDTHMDFDWYKNRAPSFDFVFTAQRNGSQQLRENGIANVHWLPLACNPALHRKHEVPKELDICFVGNVAPGPRTELLQLIQKQFQNNFVGQRHLDEMARTFSASRIVFNRSIKDDLNMRVFEALACGSLLLTNALPNNGQDELFTNSEHLATYRDSEELLDKVDYYLRHEDIRERIAAAGRKTVLQTHTYRHRMEEILRTIEDSQTTENQTDTGSTGCGYFDFARPELLALIPESARHVLDIGCGSGRLGGALKARQPATVVGIELNAKAGEAARTRLDDVIVGDVEKLDKPFEEASFDCIVCGDVLEHMRDPKKFLQRARKWLSEDGRLIASIPNVRHHSVVRSLLEGNWTYESAGLLDETHLRFFTRRDIAEMFRSVGYDITNWQITPAPGEEDLLNKNHGGNVRMGKLNIQGLPAKDAEEFFAYQYLIVAEPLRAATRELSSIVILTYNQLQYTRQCVESIQSRTTQPYELIFVDNGSTDGTVDYLRSLSNVTVIENTENRGYAAGVNQGIRASRGEYIVLLNNDVVVTSGWLDRHLNALDRDRSIGLVGPTLTWPECPQMIDPPYKDLAELETFAHTWATEKEGCVEDVPELIGACMATRREVIDRVGLLDEDFGIGQCEDKDFCRRVAAAGYRCVIARDAFVHHFGHRTFLGNNIDSGKLLVKNKQLLKEKWSASSPSSPSKNLDCQSNTLGVASANSVPLQKGTRQLKILYMRYTNPLDTSRFVKAIRDNGHDVEILDERAIESPEALIELINNGDYDCLVFFKGRINPKTQTELISPTGDGIARVLREIKIPGYTWYCDKVLDFEYNRSRELWMQKVAPLCRVAFISDGALAKHTNWGRWHILNQGIFREDVRFIDVPEDERRDIAFVGSIYGERAKELDPVAAGFQLDVVFNAHGPKLSRILRSYKIIIGPRYPSVPFYWSARLYDTLGHGAFFLAPEIEGMREEGFIPGVHYAALSDDPVADVRYWLDHPAERELIAKVGQELVLSRFTFSHRIQELVQAICNTLDSKAP